MQATLIKPRRDQAIEIAMLSNGAQSPREVGGYWTVAHCRSHHEKALALVAEDSGFGYFLPLETRRVKYGRRGAYKVTKPFPELDGYVFLSSTAAVEPDYAIPRDLHDFLHDQFSFYGLIEVRASQQERFVDDIERLHARALQGGHRSKLVKGTRCRVISGPFMGHEGIIDATDGQGYVQIHLDALKICSLFEISAAELEPI